MLQYYNKDKSLLFAALLVVLPNVITGQSTTCFGGKFVYEKIARVTLSGLTSTPLTQRKDAAITAECQAQCQASGSCSAFFIDYQASSCSSFDRNSEGLRERLTPTSGGNFFEKVCLFGVNNYDRLCGAERTWAFERVIDAALVGFDNKTINSAATRADCYKACLLETEFACRSADYNSRTRECFLSREDRRSKPEAFRIRIGSGIDYLENQCAGTLPDCRYETQNNVMVPSMDELMFAASQPDCEQLCDSAKAFTCRSYSYDQVENRCYLSGDDTISLGGIAFPPKQGSVAGERQCTVSQCELSRGTVIYEKVSGSVLRSAAETTIPTDSSAKGITEKCSDQCREEGASCPSFSVDYENRVCYKLDRNSQGRTSELTPVAGRNYFEKTCVRVPLVSSCTRKAWQFERVVGKQLRVSPDRSIPRVANRRDCIESCLLETSFLCRSAVYDSVSLSCTLSRLDRRTASDNFENAGSTVEYLENQCPPVDTTCRYEKTDNSYPRYLDATVTSVSSEEQCAFRCTNYNGFNCRSFSFYSTASECLMSGDDKISAGSSDAIASRSGTTYYERSCAGGTGVDGRFPNTIGGPGDDRFPTDRFPSGGTTGTTLPGGGFDAGFGPSRPTSGGTPIGGRNPTTGTNGFGINFPQGPTGSGSTPTLPGPGTSPGRPGSGLIPIRPNSPNPTTPGSNNGGRFPFRPGTIPGTGSGGVFPNRPGGAFNPAFPGSGGVPGTIGFPGTGGFAGTGGFPGTNRFPNTGRFPGIGGGFFGGANRCPRGRQQSFEKVSGFELSRVKSFPLFSATKPGITKECLLRCSNDPECEAFNLDHNRYECFGLERGGTSQPSDLRLYAGVDHFESVCLETISCGLLWTFERVPDFRMNIQEKERLTDITKEECMDKCLSYLECRSANYDYRGRTCFLFDQDRSSQPTAFQAAPNVDYLENQCASPPTDCRYVNREQDKFLVYVTKTYSVFSEFDCERACNLEQEFFCRAFSFIGRSSTLPDQCLLSSITGTEAGTNAFSFLRGSIFAEKQCATFNSGIGRPLPGLPRPLPGGTRQPVRPLPGAPGILPGGGVGFRPGSGGFGGTIDVGGRRPISPGVNVGFPTGDRFPISGGFGPGGYDVFNCPVATTYDKILGVDFQGARRQEIQPKEAVGITIDCLQVCDRESLRCSAVALQTPQSAPQRCFALDRAAGTQVDVLTPAPEFTYFEKVCIPERACGKAWTFVRVPGYDLSVPGRTLNNILSRQDCQAACLRANNLPCRSAVYNQRDGTCKLLAETRRTDKDQFKYVSAEYDYLENQCAPEPPSCEYTNFEGRFLPYFDRYFANVFDVLECKRYCDQERDFSCRSFNFEARRRECSISSEDTVTVGGEGALITDRAYFYADKGTCRTVKVDCTASSMIVTFLFGRPFEGRVYSQGNPQVCFEIGNRDLEVILRIPLDSTCGTSLQGNGRYVNTVMIQQHPIIMQETDKTVRVECSFDPGDQTVSFAPPGTPGRAGGGIDINNGIQLTGTGVTDVVTNTAPTPRVIMNIYRNSGNTANTVELGEILTMKIEMDEQSAFAIFARNLEARTEFGELMTLIDNVGCPRYPEIFPALQVDPSTKALYTNFKAFRFPSTGRVNFVATIRFCQEICEPVNCGGGVFSFGKRRRRSVSNETMDFTVPISIVTEPSTINTVPMEISVGTSPNLYNVTHGHTTAYLREYNVTTKVPESTTSHPNESLSRAVGIKALGNKEVSYLTPNDVPVALSLIVGDESEVDFGQFKYSRQGSTEEYICSPQSTVIVLVGAFVLLAAGAVTAFIVFHRTQKRQWKKNAFASYPGQIPHTPFGPNEVMFRSPIANFVHHRALAQTTPFSDTEKTNTNDNANFFCNRNFSET